MRSLGAATDVVEKELFAFTKGESSYALRPETTASVVRAYIQKGWAKSEPEQHLFYIGPQFRAERPAKGRYRQFDQIGAEAFGPRGGLKDAELIALAMDIFAAAGLRGVQLDINSIGCPDCRPAYRERLQAELSRSADKLCGDCNRRLKTNPLRVLDCKVEPCQGVLALAPVITDHLCQPCQGHLAELRAGLDAAGIVYRLRSRLVRGLDYYRRTVFEPCLPGIAAQDALGGGGRYDGLVSELGGPEVGASGFALGLDRIVNGLVDQGADAAAAASAPPAAAVILKDAPEPALRACAPKVLAAVLELRRAGHAVSFDTEGRSYKAQHRRAQRLGAEREIVLEAAEAHGLVAVEQLVQALLAKLQGT